MEELFVGIGQRGEEQLNTVWLLLVEKGNEQARDRGEQLPPPWLPCFPLHPPSHTLGCPHHDTTTPDSQ